MARQAQYEVPTEDELDYPVEYADRLENGFTAVQDHFGAWIAEKTQPGYKTSKETDAFIAGATAGLWLRMYHQRSPENHELQVQLAEEREAAETEAAETREAKVAEREERKAAAEQAKAEKAEARAAAKADKAKAPATSGKPAAKPGRKPGKPATSAARPAGRRPAAAGRPGRPARGGQAAF